MDLTILIPSHKEGVLVRDTYETVKYQLDQAGISDYEVIISNCFHEGDTTPQYAEQCAKQDSRVVYKQRSTCWNLGKHYRTAIAEARGRYFMMVPGDNEIVGKALASVFAKLGSADMVITYTENPEVRSMTRRFISRLFVLTYNTLFGLRLSYYNGTNLYRTDLLKNLPPITDSFGYAAEIIVRLLSTKPPATYVEVPMPIYPPQPGRKTAAFRLQNVWGVAVALGKLFWEIRTSS